MRTRISVETVRGEFQRQIEMISAETLLGCNQCGKCTAGCPLAFSMDLIPSQVIRLAQLGIEDVLDSQTIWTCASCMTCVARCPKGIDLPRVMEALRLIAMQRKGNKIQAEDLSQELLSAVPQLAIIGGFRKYTT
jgi:heterodisulfide reductase subunit C2